MIRTILVAVDGSEPALRAARLAAELAVKHQATLHLVQVAAPIPISKELEAFAHAEKIDIATSKEVATPYLLGPAESIAATAGVRTVLKEVLTGDPAERLLEYAREHAIDLVIVGRRGLGRIQRLLMGSVSFKVSSLAECPVLIVK